MGGLEEAICIKLIQQPPQSTRHGSLLERFQLTGTIGRGTHHAVIGADAGHGATIGVGIEAAIGVPKLDPCPLGLQQLSLADGLQVGAEGFVGFVEPGILQLVFGGNAYNLNISSTKSMTGHLLGGAGAIESLACILAVSEDIIPPTINHFTDDPEFDPNLNFTFNVAQKRTVRAALSNTFGFGGHNASVIFKKFEG
jgi:hypothetical protein